MEEKIKEYCEKLHVNGIPLFAFPTATEAEWIVMMDEAIKAGKPIEPDYKTDCDY